MTVEKMKLSMFTVLAVAVGFAVGCKEKEAMAQAEGEPQVQADTAMSMEAGQPAAADASEVVVTVNGKELLRGEVEQQLQQVTASPQFAQLPPERAEMVKQQMKGQIVNQFIDQTLLSQAADASAIEVTDAEIEEYLQELREYFGEEESLEARMSAQGISMEDLRRDIVADMKIRKMLDEKTADVEAASEEDVAAFYEENSEQFAVPETASAKHILITVDAEADEEARAEAKAKLQEIRQKLMADEMTFAEAAGEHSDCPSSARGGDLGSFGRGQMVPAFEAAAFSQPLNEVGEIVETDFGYHLILVTERQEASQQSLEEVREDISEQLTVGEKQEVVRAYLEELREEADIEFAQ